MSSHIFARDQLDSLSVIGDADGEFEDNYTAVRPPQYKDSNQPAGMPLPSGPSATPQTVVTTSQAPGHLASSQLEDAGQHYPASNSTATVRADEVAAATQAFHATHPQLPSSTGPAVRTDLFFYVNCGYDGGVQPLTEEAVAAHNYNSAHGSGNGTIIEWIHGRSQFSPAYPMGIVSALQKPQTSTVIRTGSKSSWSIISSSTLQPSQVEHVAEAVCATGLQFSDVSAPIGRQLLDEDFI
ncbi:hypothetical protein F5Y12DRAFT_78371 [Xylaria sp. FL1777]|nr:hypothetical protein F5Y12DRAFT_78371 [Xylaria sp. FL1777]